MALPCKIIKVDKKEVEIELFDKSLRKTPNTIKDLKQGDYALVFRNFLVEKISEKDFNEMVDAFEGKK